MKEKSRIQIIQLMNMFIGTFRFESQLLFLYIIIITQIIILYMLDFALKEKVIL